MSEILFGREFVSENTVCTSLINVNSPLAFDATMLGSLKTYARARQAVITRAVFAFNAILDFVVISTSVFSSVHAPRQNAFCADELADIVNSSGFDATPAVGLKEALGEIARDEPGPARVLIAGSLYLAGLVLADSGENA